MWETSARGTCGGGIFGEPRVCSAANGEYTEVCMSSVLLSAASLSGSDLIRTIVLAVICAVCLIVLIVAVVMFVRSDKKSRKADKGAVVSPAAGEDRAAEPSAEAESYPAESGAAAETASAADAAVTVADDEDEDYEVEIPVDVDSQGRELPQYIKDILAELTPASRALLSSYVVERRFSRMGDVWSYPSERAFLDDFFKNSIRFKRVMNAEIYTALYERAKKGKRGDTLSKLRMKYVNALYRYSAQDHALVERCVELLKDDIHYHFEIADVRNAKVASVKKLLVVFTAEKRYDEAISLCDRAIERNIYDVRQNGFEARREKLIDLSKKERG